MSASTYRRSIGWATAAAATVMTVAAIGQEPAPLDGNQIFIDSCGGCHGVAGEGGYGPPLTSNDFVDDPAKLVLRIINGGELMPTFMHLSDEEIAAVANFVRTQLNENVDLIDAAIVAAARD